MRKLALANMLFPSIAFAQQPDPAFLQADLDKANAHIKELEPKPDGEGKK